ncbi:immunity protein YezG family protein [Acinetobacter sp. TR11]|uniref:immunity protein YezG family protein n=1 Tax=Acinetobacter sp. TR11 TaxID=3003393 RepID=UPI0022AC8336|nr:hypothetical protein [Acinetobacter sp. TR11]WAU72844.1 hypothetical protein O1450_12225 [Acinetobacter sp. TR11]
MKDQEIYQQIGELLWSIMPQEAEVIYFTGKVYPDFQGWGTTFLLKKGSRGTFDFGQEPTNIELKIKDLVCDLRDLEIFKEEWTHFKVSLTEEGKIGFNFAYIPEEDDWVSLYMRGISDLSEEEWEKDYSQIPRERWEERVRIKNQSK